MILSGCLVFPDAKAMFTTCSNSYAFGSLQTKVNMFALQMDFDSMPVGSLVSRPYRVYFEPDCNFTWNDQVGIRMSAVLGIKVVDGVAARNFNIGSMGGVVYTSPAAEARGLGYVFNKYSVSRWTQCVNDRTGWIEPEYVWSTTVVHPLATGGPIAWSNIASACDDGPNVWAARNHIKIDAEVFFVKIGDSSQHQVLPQHFNVPIMDVSVYRFNGALVASFFPLLYSNSFASSVVTRSCATPTASESFIYLGVVDQQTVQGMSVGGTITNSSREFSVTFVCPNRTYGSISFFVDPVYGKADGVYGDAGVMKIAQGVGMATGVGVRLEHKLNNYSFMNVIYRTNPPYNTEFGTDYGKYEIFKSYLYEAQADINTPPQNRVVQFRASLVRLPESVTAGQIKSAALIHIRYN